MSLAVGVPWTVLSVASKTKQPCGHEHQKLIRKKKFKILNSYFEYSTRHGDRQKYVHTDI